MLPLILEYFFRVFLELSANFASTDERASIVDLYLYQYSDLPFELRLKLTATLLGKRWNNFQTEHR